MDTQPQGFSQPPLSISNCFFFLLLGNNPLRQQSSNPGICRFSLPNVQRKYRSCKPPDSDYCLGMGTLSHCPPSIFLVVLLLSDRSLLHTGSCYPIATYIISWYRASATRTLRIDSRCLIFIDPYVPRQILERHERLPGDCLAPL